MAAEFLPDWYKREFLDVEELFMDYFEFLLPDVEVLSWLPDGYYEPNGQGTEPTLRIWRQPGGRDVELRTDEALIQIAAISDSAATSWEMIEFCASMMDVLNNGFKIPRPDGTRQEVKNVRPWLGPQQVPEAPIDEKFVPMTWVVSIRGKRLLPDYRPILESLVP